MRLSRGDPVLGDPKNEALKADLRGDLTPKISGSHPRESHIPAVSRIQLIRFRIRIRIGLS